MEKNILENISLIASAISAVTAITTSLRALGKSRENEGREIRSKISTGCRVGDLQRAKKTVQTNSLLIHLISTIIWFVLSAIFATPLFIRKWAAGPDTGPILLAAPFLLLAAVIILVWRNVLHINK